MAEISMSSPKVDNNLPSTSRLLHFPTLSQSWAPDEIRTFDDGLIKYPADKYTSLKRYISIAALLPEKTVRDVALRCKWLLQKKETGKRKKVDEPIVTKKTKDKKEKITEKRPLTPNMSKLPLYNNYSFQTENKDETISSDVIGGAAGSLIEHNAKIILQIKTNLSASKVQDNNELFSKLRDNIMSVMNGMTNVPGIMNQMPPLPFKLNLDLANQILPKNMNSPVPINQRQAPNQNLHTNPHSNQHITQKQNVTHHQNHYQYQNHFQHHPQAQNQYPNHSQAQHQNHTMTQYQNPGIHIDQVQNQYQGQNPIQNPYQSPNQIHRGSPVPNQYQSQSQQHSQIQNHVQNQYQNLSQQPNLSHSHIQNQHQHQNQQHFSAPASSPPQLQVVS